MKSYFFILLLFLTTKPLQAQLKDKTIDSLQHLVHQASSDSIKARLLLNIGNEFLYRIRKLDSALLYNQKAFDLARQRNITELHLLAGNNLANIYNHGMGNYSEALRILLANLALEERLHDTTDKIFFTKREIMWVYRNIGDHQKELELAKELGSFVTSGYFKDHKRVNWYQNAVYHNLANTYLRLNELDSAIQYRALLYSRAKQTNEPIWMALATGGLADLYIKLNKLDSAFHYTRLSMLYGMVTSRADIRIEARMNLAHLFEKTGQKDSAFHYARQALQLYKNVPDTSGMLDAAFLLSNLHKEQKQFDSAFYFLSYYTSLKDSSLQSEKIQKAQTLLFNEQQRQQQQVQERKEARQRYQTNLKVYSLAVVLFLVALVAFFINRNSQQRKKANALLHRKNLQIENTLQELKATQAKLIQSEKMASLGELTAGVAHEIQNPLNFVNNFSETNAELFQEAEMEYEAGKHEDAFAILKDVKSNNEKINQHGRRADAIVKSMLEHSRTTKGEKQPTDINAFTDEYLRLAYHGFRAKDKSFNATIETHFDESIGKMHIVPQEIGRVLLNLLNNAFWAVSDKAKQADGNFEPTVSVSSKRVDGKVEITVQDNGTGIPQEVIDKVFQPFFTTKPTGQGTGLGLSLSYDIVKAHGGELRVESMEGEGAQFSIELPLHQIAS